ncbi:uncharacterized protein LY89DRAFT_763815 [Mollisia scopiformis]|uniref:Uncharacterized protein n=1 Tax=Mollisia scopiformis TaxID=149040 RepID=A0A132B9V5_MOLSC|nr:uncharacterized protein LY89DRAFT_763815 [Mollisia scopiformis]KUJ09161.1 hypothetical protein LY89DRAFT_763815 [Mollisia scopiformis]
MADNSLMMADMIGKLMDMQQQLAHKQSSSRDLQQKINNLHLVVDNICRSFQKIGDLPTLRVDADDQTAVILAPTEKAHRSFLGSFFLKRAKHNPLPWMKHDSDQQQEEISQPTKQQAPKHKSESRVEKAKSMSNAKGMFAPRAPLSEKSTNAPATSQLFSKGPKSEAKNLHQRKFRSLARVGSSLLQDLQNLAAEKPAPTEDSFKFPTLAYRPRPALSNALFEPPGSSKTSYGKLAISDNFDAKENKGR